MAICELTAENQYLIRSAWGRGEVCTGFWLGGLKVRDHWKDLGVGGRITLNCTLGRQGSIERLGELDSAGSV
jgi:hypothetical protein